MHAQACASRAGPDLLRRNGARPTRTASVWPVLANERSGTSACLVAKICSATSSRPRLTCCWGLSATCRPDKLDTSCNLRQLTHCRPIPFLSERPVPERVRLGFLLPIEERPEESRSLSVGSTTERWTHLRPSICGQPGLAAGCVLVSTDLAGKACSSESKLCGCVLRGGPARANRKRLAARAASLRCCFGCASRKS